MQISFILVEPKVPENIGAAARAIKTMGYKRLVLIKPCEYKTGPAQWLAHGSSDILGKAEVYGSLEEALTGTDITIGTTARHRNIKGEYTSPEDLRSLLARESGNYKKVALVFGREESGLSNEEISLCDITSTISLAAPYPSLNLSQAVMLYAYVLGGIKPADIDKNTVSAPGMHSLGLLKNKIESLLSGTPVSENRALKGRIMERLALADGKDIKLFHSIANALLNKYEKARK